MRLIIGVFLVFCCVQSFMFQGGYCNDGKPAETPETPAGEDVIDDEATVESEEKPDAAKTGEATEPPNQDTQTPDSALQDQGPQDEMPDGLPKPSSSAETRMVFIDPSIGQIPRTTQKGGSIIPLDVPVGQPVNVLISFQHKGGLEAKEGFFLDAVAACLRYPMDYNYYIQNFTARRLNDLTVEPLKTASIDYSFIPAQQLIGRPYGLSVRVFYHDQAGQSYVSTVMNETVQLVEYEVAPGSVYVDTEAIFLYVVILGLFALFFIGLYQLWMSYGPKRLTKSIGGGSRSSKSGSGSSSISNDKFSKSRDAAKDEEDNGLLQEATANALAKGVDPDWIPKDVLLREGVKRSPTQQQSPKSRRNRA